MGWVDSATRTRLPPVVLAVVTVVLLFGRSLAQSPNTDPGSLALDKRQYEKALSLFSSAIERNPRNAFAWLDKGRTIAMMNGAKPPDDYCDSDNNWIFLALAHLNEALRLDPKAVAERIRTDRSEFASFRETVEFKLWWATAGPLPNTDAELRTFFRENPTWNKEGSAIPIREALTLRADGQAELFSAGQTKSGGAWRVSGGKLTIVNGKRIDSYQLVRTQFFIRDGSLHFDFLQLGTEWTMGKILHDCTF